MTPAQLSEIEARAKKATPGPWLSAMLCIEIDDGRGSSFVRNHYADGHFACSARSDVPALCAALREAWRERGEARHERDVERTCFEVACEQRDASEKERDQARAERDARPTPEVVAKVIRSLSQLHDFAAVYSPSHNTDMLVEAREALRLLGDE